MSGEIDILNPEKPKQIASVDSNLAVSKQTAQLIPVWIIGFGVLASLLLATGAGISLFAPQLLAPGAEINVLAHIYAGYTFSRDLSLFVVFSIALIRRLRATLSIAMGMFSLMNFFDAVMDIAESRYAIVPIALVFSLLAALAFARTTSLGDKPTG